MVNDKDKLNKKVNDSQSLQHNREQEKSIDIKVGKKKNNKKVNKGTEQHKQESVINPEQQFELELCWCIESLENSLASLDLKSKGDTKPSKAAMDLEKIIKTLKSTGQPVIAKRQVMRTVLGDYRTKMAKDKKKWNMSAKNFGFDTTQTDGGSETKQKGKFIKKVTSRTAIDKNVVNKETEDLGNKTDKNINLPDNTFRFNFNVPVVGGDV